MPSRLRGDTKTVGKARPQPAGAKSVEEMGGEMFLMIPLGFLLVGAVVVMVLLSQNLTRLDGEAQAAWERFASAGEGVSAGDVAQRAVLYNNAATLYNNAGRAFPLNTIAKRLGFKPRSLVSSRSGSTCDHSTVAEESIAEKSRIMNAYMLWAVGMSDYTMEEDPDDAHRP